MNRLVSFCAISQSFVFIFFILKPNPKGLADLGNKPKPLNLTNYALFAIGFFAIWRSKP